jgi:hypothetical protein
VQFEEGLFKWRVEGFGDRNTINSTNAAAALDAPLASGDAIARPTVAMCDVFQVLLSTMMVRLAIAVVW